jgi:hypothetical protein
MIQCRNCINWADESLDQIEADHSAHPHIFMGCRIYGFLEKNEDLPECRDYVASEDLFTICSSCHITVPRVCVSLGECVNCMDTDLFCVESCKGRESRRYCTHFVRLRTEGMQIIDNDQVFDLFPNQGMPGREELSEPESRATNSPKEKAVKDPPPRA